MTKLAFIIHCCGVSFGVRLHVNISQDDLQESTRGVAQ